MLERFKTFLQISRTWLYVIQNAKHSQDIFKNISVLHLLQPYMVIYLA